MRLGLACEGRASGVKDFCCRASRGGRVDLLLQDPFRSLPQRCCPHDCSACHRLPLPRTPTQIPSRARRRPQPPARAPETPQSTRLCHCPFLPSPERLAHWTLKLAKLAQLSASDSHHRPDDVSQAHPPARSALHRSNEPLLTIASPLAPKAALVRPSPRR